MTTRLNPENVPASLRSLLSLADRWAIGDDGDRENAIDAAAVPDLEALVAKVEPVRALLHGWLGGPESMSATPTREYVALSIVAEAEESAAIKLRPRQPVSARDRQAITKSLLEAFGPDEDVDE